jgi:hypothetical protein
MELKIVDFRYTKEDGQKSDRKLLVLSSPSDSYFGIEVDYDLTPVKPYLQYMEELRDLEQNLKAKYGIQGLNLPYKRFKEDKISRLLEEKIDVDVNTL